MPITPETRTQKQTFDAAQKNVLGERKDMSPEAATRQQEIIEEKKERIAQVLSQGVVGHALVDHKTEEGRRYVYVRENDADISRFTALGYRVETGQEKGMHGTGDGKRRIGDTILMSTDLDTYSLIEEVKTDRNLKKMNSPVKEYKERAAEAAARREAAPPVDFMETRR